VGWKQRPAQRHQASAKGGRHPFKRVKEEGAENKDCNIFTSGRRDQKKGDYRRGTRGEGSALAEKKKVEQQQKECPSNLKRPIEVSKDPRGIRGDLTRGHIIGWVGRGKGKRNATLTPNQTGARKRGQRATEPGMGVRGK